MRNVMTVTAGNFESEVLRSGVPVIVDYWAPWCLPCRALAPILDQIAAERPGTLKFVKVNVDDEPELADRAGVRGIPYVVLYRDGRAVADAVGAYPKRALEQRLGLNGSGHAAA
jgi:thioredoxin 1